MINKNMSHSTLSELTLFLHRLVVIPVHGWSVDHELPQVGACRAVVLKVWSGEPWESPWHFQWVHKVKTIFYNSTKVLFSFSSLFSHEYTVQFCDMWWHHPMTADGMYVCMFKCFKSLSVLTFNAININQYNPPKQKPFGHSQWFKSIKGL